jgi:hypothetical protein
MDDEYQRKCKEAANDIAEMFMEGDTFLDRYIALTDELDDTLFGVLFVELSKTVRSREPTYYR